MPIFRGKNFVSASSDYKDSVRVAMRTHLALNVSVYIIDGITLNDKDRVLLAGQNSASQNGIYEWNGTTGTLARSTDADSRFELTAGTRVYVEEGTYAQTTWTLLTTGVITPDSTGLVFAKDSRIGPVDNSGVYGATNKTLIITLSDTGQIDAISASDIDLDGGSF